MAEIFRNVSEKRLIAVTTFQRPDDLKRLLTSLSLAIQNFQNVDVVVVDNDPRQTAREIVTKSYLRPIYAVESAPGIPSARNKCLEIFEAGNYASIAFIDDDMWVDQKWFEEYINLSNINKYCIISGAVISVLPENAPLWASAGKYYQRNSYPTGHRRTTSGGGNVFMTREAWNLGGKCRFDLQFASTGGEDSDFFYTLHEKGIPIIACEEAVAYEDVTSDRLNMMWLQNRYIRNGIIEVMIKRKRKKSSSLILMKGVVQIFYYFPWGLTSYLVRADFGSKFNSALFSHVGRVRAISGKTIKQYRDVL